MNLVHESISIDLIVRVFDNGVRIVIQGDTDSWVKYFIIPRSLVIDQIQRLRQQGWQYKQMNLLSVVPYCVQPLIAIEHEGSPGQSYARHPYAIKKNKRMLVIYQRGGLDI